MFLRIVAFGLTFTLGLAHAQTVEITTLGVGSTPSDAETVALRSALEQCYGVFLSAKSELSETSTTVDGETSQTSMLFENMATITSGEIVSYEVLEQTEESIQGQPSRFHVVVKSRVSVEAVANYARSKGVEVQLAGGMFAQNIKLRQLNEEAEITALENLVDQTALMLNNCVDFEVQYEDPKEHLDGLWQLNVIASGRWNAYFDTWLDVVWNSLKGISCSSEEEEQRQQMQQSIWRVRALKDADTLDVVFRAPESIFLFSDVLLLLRRSLLNFKVDADVRAISGFDAFHENLYQPDSGAPILNGQLGTTSSGFHKWKSLIWVNYTNDFEDVSKIPLLNYRACRSNSELRAPRTYMHPEKAAKPIYCHNSKSLRSIYSQKNLTYFTGWMNQGYSLRELQKSKPTNLTGAADNNIGGLMGAQFGQESHNISMYEVGTDETRYHFIPWDMNELKEGNNQLEFTFPIFLRMDELEQIQSIEISPARLLE